MMVILGRILYFQREKVERKKKILCNTAKTLSGGCSIGKVRSYLIKEEILCSESDFLGEWGGGHSLF